VNGLSCVREVVEGRNALGDLRHLSDSHGHAVRKEGREVGDIGEGEVPTGVPCGTDSSIVIEQPLIQIRRSAATLTDGQ
jgi:hypothetical protein